MARIRTIKPTAFSSESLARVSVAARWTFAGLWTYVDDEGRGKADPRLVKAHVWPLDDDVDATQVGELMDELETEGMIRRYVVDGRTYLQVVNWQHQKISHPTKSILPEEPSRVGGRPLTEVSGNSPEESRTPKDSFAPDFDLEVEGIGSVSPRKRGARLPEDWKPTEADVTWQRSKGIADTLARREFEKFTNYWLAKTGRDASKLDWSLTWHTWLLNAQERVAGPVPEIAQARVAARQSDGLASAR